MGNNTSNSLPAEATDSLVEKTHFDEKELKDLFKQFKKEIPQGTITKKEFQDAMKSIGFVDPDFQDYIFSFFDKSGSNEITFDSFVQVLSVLSRGTVEEKLDFAFHMLDYDDDGFISKADLNHVLTTQYRLVGPLITFSKKRYDNVDKLVEDFFDQIDIRGEGKIDLDAYKEGALKNLDIVEGFKLFHEA